MVTYQFEVDDDEWEAWKRTVPRTKPLDERLRELIRADTGGETEAGQGDDVEPVADAGNDDSGDEKEPTGETHISTPRLEADFPAAVSPRDAERAVLAARDLIQEERGATKKEIVREVMPQHPLQYDPDDALDKIEAGDRFRGAWWRRVIKPGLEALEEVEKPTGGRSEWRYAGEE